MNENKFAKISELKITTEFRNNKTIISNQFFTPPFKIMKPFYDEDNNAKLMVLSSSAGLMSGDRQNISFDVGKGTKLTVISQSYEKIHRMEDGFAERNAVIKIEDNAFLDWSWLPVIPFADSSFEGRADFSITDTSKLIISEVLSCGRSERGEKFLFKKYKNLTTVKRNNVLIYRDNVVFIPEKVDVSGYGMFENHTHILSVTAFGFFGLNQKKSALNDYFKEHSIDGGVSITASGDLAVRCFGSSGDILYKLSERIIEIIKKEE